MGAVISVTSIEAVPVQPPVAVYSTETFPDSPALHVSVMVLVLELPEASGAVQIYPAPAVALKTAGDPVQTSVGPVTWGLGFTTILTSNVGPSQPPYLGVTM